MLSHERLLSGSMRPSALLFLFLSFAYFALAPGLLSADARSSSKR